MINDEFMKEVKGNFTKAVLDTRTKRIGEIIGQFKKETRDKMVDDNREVLTKNNFLEYMSNLLIVSPSADVASYKLTNLSDGEVNYNPVTSDLAPALDILNSVLTGKMKKDAAEALLVTHKDVLDKYELTDILNEKKYSVTPLPSKYHVMVKEPGAEENKIVSIKYENEEIYDLIEEYYKSTDDAIEKDMFNQLKKYIESEEYENTYNQLKNEFDAELKKEYLTDEQIVEANKLFMEIPYDKIIEKNKENDFCFDILKSVQDSYKVNPNLGVAWLKLPEVVYKSENDLKAEALNKNIIVRGAQKIKSKIKNVRNLRAKPEKKVSKTVSAADARREYILRYSAVWPLEELAEYANQLPEDKKAEIIKKAEELEQTIVDSLSGFTADDIKDKPNKNDYKGRKIEYFVDKLNYRHSIKTFKRLDKRATALYRSKTGDKPITVSELFKSEDGKNIAIPLSQLIQLTNEARQIKVTNGAVTKLVDSKMEQDKTKNEEVVPLDIKYLENKYDVAPLDIKYLENKYEVENKEQDIQTIVAEEPKMDDSIMEEPKMEQDIQTIVAEEPKMDDSIIEEPKDIITETPEIEPTTIDSVNHEPNSLKDSILQVFESLSAEDFETLAEAKRKQHTVEDERFSTFDKHKKRHDEEVKVNEIWSELLPIIDNPDYQKEAVESATEAINQKTEAHEQERSEMKQERDGVVMKSRASALQNKINVGLITGDLNLDSLAQLNSTVSEMSNEGKTR